MFQTFEFKHVKLYRTVENLLQCMRYPWTILLAMLLSVSEPLASLWPVSTVQWLGSAQTAPSDNKQVTQVTQ